MAQSVVHIGLHKTATTWLQRHLFPLVTSHRVVERELIQEALIRQHAFAFDAERARNTMHLRPAEAVLLSEEHLSGDLFNDGFRGALSRELARRIRATLPDSEIALVIRRQSDIIASTYGQYVAVGGTHTLARFLFHPELKWYIPGFDFDHYDYRKWIEYYRAEFGPERVHVFLYEDFATDNRAFVDSFLQRLGLTVSGVPAYAARERPRLGAVELAVFRFWNRFRRGGLAHKHYFLHVPGARRVGKRLSRLAGAALGHKPGQVPQPIHEFIRARYAESNAWVMRETGLDLARHGYPCSKAES
jgi:hypothetical protein